MITNLNTGLPVVGLLDVDGVLNGSRTGWDAPPVSRTVWVNGTGYRVRWAPQLAGEIRALHQEGLIEWRWATSWVGNTRALETIMGLPHFPDAFPADVPDILAAKRLAALRVVDAGHRLVWLDDEAFLDAWTPAGFLRDAGHLLISPNPRRGLRPADIQAIREFCEA